MYGVGFGAISSLVIALPGFPSLKICRAPQPCPNVNFVTFNGFVSKLTKEVLNGQFHFGQYSYGPD
jgi:hypothetical protein